MRGFAKRRCGPSPIRMVLGAGQALAVDVPTPHIEDLGGKTYVTSYKTGKDFGYRSYCSVKYPSKKIKAISSSNTEVADVSASNYGKKQHYLNVDIHKVGTTDITYSIGGKKHTVKYVVKNYVNPVKTFKIGKKNYAKYFNLKNLAPVSGSDARGSVVSSGFKGKIKIKPSSGWKLQKVYYAKSGTKGMIKTTKNNANLKVKSWAMWLTFKNKKTKQKEILYLTADSKSLHKLIMATY